MKDYAANSNKSKEDNPTEARPKVEKAVKGDVIIAKRSLGTRMKSLFFGGDANTTAQYVLAEVIVPAARNLIVETFNRAIEQMVYGNQGPRRRITERPSYSPRVQYHRPVERDGYQPRGYVPGQAPRSDKMFEDVIVGTREDADVVIERVGDIVDKYTVVSIADVLAILGMDSTHVDNKWGWPGLPTIGIQQVREGWKISFPTPEEI